MIFLAMNAGADAQVFISPSGNDANPGTAIRPVASLARGVELSRHLPRTKTRAIRLGEGDYFDTCVTLNSKDSDLIIEAEAGRRATLIGGVSLSGWINESQHWWSAPLPGRKDWDIRMLQVNGRFCPRARFPEQDTLTHLTTFNVPWMSTTGGGWKRKPTAEELTTLRYKKGDVPEDLDISNAEITVFHMWDESVARISRHDIATSTFILSPQLGHPPGAFGVQKYCLWNIRQGMNRPGQYYFDRGRQRVVYWPLEQEDIGNTVAIVPTQYSILAVTDTTNVTLRNLSFSVTTVPLITGGFAAGAFGGAIEIKDAQDIALSNLRIVNVAGHGVKGLGNQRSILVTDCDISFCGAGGVYLTGPNNIVSNTLIHDVGLMFPSAIGINGDGENCKLSHNEIHDTTYSAIGFGGKHTVIENNEISACMKVLHDGAAIYCFGAKRGILRNNFAHDILDTGGYGASAYYLDEQSENCVVERNISLNVARPSHNHMATNNVIRQNVFVSQGDMRITFPRCTDYRLEGNVIYARGGILFEGIENVASWSRNIVYSGTGKIEGTRLKEYTTLARMPGICGDTLVTNPLFKSLSELDLRYDEASPASKLDLTPLDVTTAGRIGKR